MNPNNSKFNFYGRLVIIEVITAFTLIFSGCNAQDRSGDGELSAYEKGLAALEMFDFGEAYDQLSIAQRELSPSDENWLDATYAYALASWHRPPPRAETINQAEGLFNELLAADISDDWKTRVKLSLARIYEVNDYPGDIVELDKARALYRDVVETHPTGEFGYQSSLRLAQTYIQQLDTSSILEGIKIIEEQIERDPDSNWANIAYQYLGDTYYFGMADPTKALEYYLIAEELGFSNDSSTHFFLWRMAEWANELGEEREAVRLWTRIVNEFPRSAYGTLSRDNVRAYVKKHPDSGITPPELQTW